VVQVKQSVWFMCLYIWTMLIKFNVTGQISQSQDEQEAQLS